MTYAELVNLIETNLTRVGNNRVSAPEIKQVARAILDFAAAIDNADAIPTWTNLLTFQTDGTGAGKYCKHPDVNGKLRIFETKVANNTGNSPPTDPNITENASWKEISASAGSGIQEWAPGLFGEGLVIVHHNHSVDADGIYKLTEPVRPFNSVNIESEITAGKWVRLNIDNLSAVLAKGNSAGNKRIINLLDPVDPQDAATKAYVLQALTAVGRPRGGFDASSGAVPAPTADNEAGDFWRITVAGTIGTMVLKVGDVLFAAIDDAAVAADFYAVQSNVDLATDTVLGLIKLYGTTSGSATDGAPSQFAVNAAIGGIQQDQETLKIYKMTNFGSP